MLGVTLNSQVKNIAFVLFIFTLGYMSGPSFSASLNKKSLRYGVFTAAVLLTRTKWPGSVDNSR